MEVLSRSALQIQSFPERSLGIQHAKTGSKHCVLLRTHPSFSKAPSLRCASRVSALPRDIPDEGSGQEEGPLDNKNGALSFGSEETLSSSQCSRCRSILLRQASGGSGSYLTDGNSCSTNNTTALVYGGTTSF